MADETSRGLQWVNAISALVAALAIPIVLAVLGHSYSTALKEREIQSHFVELALAVLKEPPRPENQAVREWALDVVDRYSGVPLGEEASRELASAVSFPAPVSTTSRVYLLAGRGASAPLLDSLRADLSRAGFNVVGQNAALVDEGRPQVPEVRYFNLSDKAEADMIAERLRLRLQQPALNARYYEDPSAKAGYIEIWLGR